jgi:hypothetical protein
VPPRRPASTSNPGPHYGKSKAARFGLAFGYGMIPAERIEDGIRGLARILR